VREALIQVGGIRLAFIFGSMAKGTADAKSDVDILIVGDASFADISEALLAAQERLGREITPTVYSAEEFQQRVKEKHHFLARVLAEPKIMLIGTPDDIERMG
jgi:predicted nucleotidyltransferase